MSGDSTTRMSSVLGPTAVVIGNVKGAGDLEIRGRVQGSVAVVGRISIADSGVVLGDVEAIQISVAGEVRGSLVAQDGVAIASSGRVEGDIAAPRVGIEAGARVRGHLRTGGELPDRSEHLKPMLTPDKHASQQSAGKPVVDAPRRAPVIEQAVIEQAVIEQAITEPAVSRPAVIEPSVVGPTTFDAASTTPPIAAAPSSSDSKGAPASSEYSAGRTRKSKRPRPPFAGSGGESPPQQRSVPQHKAAAQTPRERPRGPAGPPRVPTFEKGVKPRSRS